MSNDKTTELPFKFGETLNLTQDNIQVEGDVIGGKYKILETIGKGGMGKIFRAEQLELGREVAIKVMLAPDDEVSSKRFMQEAAITAGLSHPNTIRVFDFGRMDDESLYLVMEYIDGINIKQSIKSNGPFPPQQAMKLACQLCGSLGEAHRKDLIHRDIKPGNIMLIDSPEEGLLTKLLDFGLVKHTEKTSDISQTGNILGSPMYMSPEQINGEVIDARSDIYSLGLTLYYVLCGKAPFNEANISGILAAQLFKTPTPIIEHNVLLESCPALNWIIDTATQKDREERFQSVLQMKQALEIALNDGMAPLAMRDGALYHKDKLIEGTALLGLKMTPTSGGVNDSQATMTKPVEDMTMSNTMGLTSQTMHMQLQRNNRIVAMISICSLLILSFLVYSVVYNNPQAPAPATVTPTQSVQAPTPEQPVTPKAVNIELISVPSGATVYDPELKTIRGQTPWSIELEKNSSLSIELQMEGYESLPVTLFSESPKVTYTLKAIEKKKKPSTKTSTPRPQKNVNASKTEEAPKVDKNKDKPKNFEKKTANPFGN